ncbi:hypothetical protein KR018_001555 [Drosophila ironensis]|nr:hypothetical protein KR018_001555 [Drosophila ironensis]
MSLVDHDSWDIEYEGCERLHHQILVHLNQRQQLTPQDPKYVHLTSNIKSALEQLTKDVQHLRVVLDNAITWETVSEEELQERRVDFDRLSSQLRSVNEKFDLSRGPTSSSGATASSSVWQGANPVREVPTDVASLKQRQAELVQQQNQGLDILSSTLSRQREQALRLGNEVEDQNNILDNLSSAMDRVETGVQQETRNIGLVSRRDSTWGYWLVIISLFIAIVVVIFV